MSQTLYNRPETNYTGIMQAYISSDKQTFATRDECVAHEEIIRAKKVMEQYLPTAKGQLLINKHKLTDIATWVVISAGTKTEILKVFRGTLQNTLMQVISDNRFFVHKNNVGTIQSAEFQIIN